MMRKVSALEELFMRAVDALAEQLRLRNLNGEIVAERYRREWAELLEPTRERIDEIRQAGEWRLTVHRRGMPDGWAHVHLTGAEGLHYFSGLLEESSIALEMLVQIERAKVFIRDQELHEAG